jgi:hypothetical protein
LQASNDVKWEMGDFVGFDVWWWWWWWGSYILVRDGEWLVIAIINLDCIVNQY